MCFDFVYPEIYPYISSINKLNTETQRAQRIKKLCALCVSVFNNIFIRLAYKSLFLSKFV